MRYKETNVRDLETFTGGWQAAYNLSTFSHQSIQNIGTICTPADAVVHQETRGGLHTRTRALRSI